jgi:hypothetical protein
MAAEHVAGNMDKAVSSFIRSFEENYTRLEAAIRKRVDWTAPKRGRPGGIGGGPGGAAAAAAAVTAGGGARRGAAWGGRDLGPMLGAALQASSNDESDDSL